MPPIHHLSSTVCRTVPRSFHLEPQALDQRTIQIHLLHLIETEPMDILLNGPCTFT